MKGPVALIMMGLSLLIIFQADCKDENIVSVINRMVDLDEEIFDIRRDLLRVEDKISSRIDFAKTSLSSDLSQQLQEHVIQAVAEILQGESIEELIRSQVISEVRQQKRENHLIKSQLRRVLSSLRHVQSERSENKLSSAKSELALTRSSFDDIRKKRRKDVARIKTMEKRIAQFENAAHQTIQKSLNATEQELSSTKSELALTRSSFADIRKERREDVARIKTMEKRIAQFENATHQTIQKSLNATEQELSSTKSELALTRSSFADIRKERREDVARIKTMAKRIAQFENATHQTIQKSLNATEQELSSTKSELALTRSSFADIRKERREDVARIKTMAKRIAQFENATHQTTRSVSYQVRQRVSLLTVAKGETLKFDDVTLNIGNAYNSDSGVFTAPVTGTYIFWAGIMSADTGDIDIELNIEGSRQLIGYSSPTVGYGTAHITYMTQVTKGQKVLFVNIDAVTIQIHGHKYSSYGGTLLTTP